LIQTKIVTEFFHNVQAASSELAKKEHFITLLSRLFDNDPSLSVIIDEINKGAEHTVFKIPLENRIKTGAADTQFRNTIIEFERDLKRTELHAKEQLIEYFAGNWNSGNIYDFLLIATDCITWKIYSPNYEKLIDTVNITIADVELEEKSSFILTDKNGEEFFFFIDHYFFRKQLQKPTYQNIKNDFGDLSSTFLYSIKELTEYFYQIKDDSEIKIAFEEWNLFLSIAYGKFTGTGKVFLIHTYLSIFSKILAYAVITKKQTVSDEEIQEILSGEIFNRLNVGNFIESDFYFWVAKKEHYKNLKKVFRRIINQIGDYDFSKVEEDVLKGVYQELIDIETRHGLGEYYTPDWLADKIVEELPLQKDSKILDPACGSGTFLKSAISKLRTEYPDITLNEILSQVIGIDIHPLSVQVAKTTILLSIADKLRKAKKPVNIQVYLANTLIIPTEGVSLFSESFDVPINKKIYHITNEMWNNDTFYDESIVYCEKLALMDKHKISLTEKKFGEGLSNEFKNYRVSNNIIDSLHRIYLALKEAIENKQNSIWSFILQNSYKPFFMRGQFDFVIGNPPWLPYRDMNNEAYQTQLFNIAKTYNLVPKHDSITHLELAAIFLSYCSTNFLKKEGIIAFVLPRGFISADHHENTRNGSAQGFRIKQIWDLKDVAPLFRITSCVVFAERKIIHIEKGKSSLLYEDGKLRGYIFSGKLPAYNVNLAEAENYLEFKKVNWFYSRLGKRSSFSIHKIDFSSEGNFYLEKFKQGATIVPRNLYFVELLQDKPEDFADRILYVQTDQKIKKEAKQPWADIDLKMQINSCFLFRTAISKNILPFALVNPVFVHLPVVIDDNNNLSLLDWKAIRERGLLASAGWFQKVEEFWDKDKTEKSKNITYLQWLNWQSKITDQNLSKKYLVLYTASAKDANAVIVDRTKIDLPFIMESKTYWYSTNIKEEAAYLTAFLNSNFANESIKDFQSTGLFGHRDIHKKILEISLPQYDDKNKTHKEISRLSKICFEKTGRFVSTLTYNNETTGIKLGNARLEVRELLKEELGKIDPLLKEIIAHK
jgi:methylase of polypeptide subunit release factors